MKRSTWATAAGLLALSTLSPLTSRAADHRDWPGYMTDIAADITDVYAWMSPDASKVYLAVDIQGANTGATTSTKFSDAVQYVIHVNSASAFGMPQNKADTIICKFDNAATQNFECWGPSATGQTEYVKDAVGNASGKTSKSGKMRVFAGLRDDPFYFNIRGFLQTAATVKAVATGGMLATPDAAGCSKLTMQQSTAVVGQLKGDGATGAGVDDFGKNGKSLLSPQGGATNGNILAIVIAIDKTLLNTGGDIVSVWASTNR